MKGQVRSLKILHNEPQNMSSHVQKGATPMLNRVSYHAATLTLVALLMTAGCAKQSVVKKDDGIAPAPVAKQTDRSKASATPPGQTVTTPDIQAAPAAAAPRQAQNSLANAKLQAALEKIYFDFDSSTLTESARGTLAKNVDLLKKETSPKIRIEGNCDESGSAEYNLALGERRAKSAQQYLVALGVKPDRLSTVSYGKEKPAIQGSSESAGTKNRRDEFVVVTP
jgi:peptidoglycan-associated lipoprotein